MLSSGISTTSGIVTLQSGNSDDRSGDTNIETGNINIKRYIISCKVTKLVI